MRSAREIAYVIVSYLIEHRKTCPLYGSGVSIDVDVAGVGDAKEEPLVGREDASPYLRARTVTCNVDVVLVVGTGVLKGPTLVIRSRVTASKMCTNSSFEAIAMTDSLGFQIEYVA